MQTALQARDNDLAQVVTALTGQKPEKIVPAGRGGNSRVFRVECGKDVYALKSYPHTPKDPRNRQQAEKSAFAFFERHGIACVPRWVGEVPGYALLSWVDDPLAVPPVDTDIVQAVAFLAAIRSHSHSANTRDIGPASESCASLLEIETRVFTRLMQLEAAAGREATLADFLDRDFAPVWKKTWKRVQAAFAARGIAPDKPLEKQCLIPADFGFHNALRGKDGKLTFIDFEYFGWDDPARLAADFCLHPGMELSAAQKKNFRTGMEEAFGDDTDFAFRFRALTPVLALRWSLILLNAFLPQYWYSRSHSGAKGWPEAKERQLAKARRMLKNAKEFLDV